MNLNYLKLNIYKTNVIFLAKPHILNIYPMDIGSQKFTLNNKNKLKILGINIIQSLLCKNIIQQHLGPCYFYLFKLIK